MSCYYKTIAMSLGEILLMMLTQIELFVITYNMGVSAILITNIIESSVY